MKYILLPGVFPRAKELASGGFGYLAFLFACVYRAVRILPANHPFVNPDNIGKFGIVKVIAAAGNNVQVNRRNIDQIIVFLALLAAIILMFMQFIFLILALFSGKAFAAAPFKSIFVTENPETDIAFLMLDYVFGIPSGGGANATFFGSNALQESGGPTAFQQGMHALFNFYNLAILLVGVLIFLYFVVVVVIETAQTGVPFGRRFSKLYAPFRLIAAIGLLVPLNYGFNGAQYITLYAAKLGSSMATNGWILYNRSLQNPMGVPNSALVAKPNSPAVDELLYFSSVYHACRESYKIMAPLNNGNTGAGTIKILPYVIIDGNAQEFAKYDYTTAKQKVGKSDLEVVLGELNKDTNKGYAGGVRPYCGKINLSLVNDNPPAFKNSGGGAGGGGTKGVLGVEQAYYKLMQKYLGDDDTTFKALGERAAHYFVDLNNAHDPCYQSGKLGDSGTCGKEKWGPNAAVFQTEMSAQKKALEKEIQDHYDELKDGLDLKLTSEMEKRGWGGAGIFYNNIADLNGSFTGAIYATPSIKKYPEIMEDVKKARQVQDTSSGSCDLFEPNLADNKKVTWTNTNDDKIAIPLNKAYKYFVCERATQDNNTNTGSTKGLTSNAVINVIEIVFGLNGLMDMRKNSEADPNTGMPIVHPLAQLSTIGKSLVENAIRSMGFAVGAAFGGGMLGALDQSAGAALGSLSGMFVGIATIGLSAGFVLFYILPFLPFIYFFFAVGSWVKSIFEAMVGVPLWALAHLHIDGDGFSGRAARGGYFLIFEIFLRPIVTVFGLIGGMAIFGAMVATLNVIFDLVVTNVTGAPTDATATIDTTTIEGLRRGIIDQFFFTIMYTILVYMMGTSSFKMIDSVPKNIMRWIGSQVGTFNDNTGDPAGSLTEYAAIGGARVSGDLLKGITGAAQGTGNLVGSFTKTVTDSGQQPPAKP